MGGKALKHTRTVRYPANKYFELVDEVLSACRKEFPNIPMEDIKAYREKTSFGDLDVVVQNRPGLKESFASFLKKQRVSEIVMNGPVWSVGWRDFQVDFLFHSEYDFCRHYFAWNDLGNLIGRVAHNLGFKFGHDGLWYILRDGDYVVHRLLLTTDFHKALDFLGFDAARYNEGFDRLEDIFLYVTSNPYFRPEPYLLENRNHQSRVRDAKRPTYTNFLAWLEDQQFPKQSSNKGDHLLRAQSEFPDFSKELKKAIEQNEQRKKAKQRFNGKLVSGLTGLEGKELGAFIKLLKLQVENLTNHVLQSSDKELELWVRSEYLKQRSQAH